MIRLVLVKPLLGLPAGAEIIVAHAQSDVVAPACGSDVPSASAVRPSPPRVEGTLARPGDPTGTRWATRCCPPRAAPTATAPRPPSPASSRRARPPTPRRAPLDPNPDSTSHSVVQGLNVLGGLVTADVLDVASTSYGRRDHGRDHLRGDLRQPQGGRRHRRGPNVGPQHHHLRPLRGRPGAGGAQRAGGQLQRHHRHRRHGQRHPRLRVQRSRACSAGR